MTNEDHLENRIADLERNLNSLRYTLLFMVVCLIVAACIQYKIDDSLKRQIRDANSISVQEVKYVE